MEGDACRCGGRSLSLDVQLRLLRSRRWLAPRWGVRALSSSSPALLIREHLVAPDS